MAESEGLNADLAGLAGFVMARIVSDFEAGRPTVQQLAALANEEERMRLAVKLIEALAPAAPDPVVWSEWLDGGPSPRSDIEVAKFDPRKVASSRKIEGAKGRYSEASEKAEKARANLRKARQELAAAEQAVEAAEWEETRAASLAQGVVIWGVLRTIMSTSRAIFAMRVAGPLLRAISPFPSNAEQDFVTQRMETGPAKDAAKEEYRVQCAQDYQSMVAALDFFDGDGRFQSEVRKNLLGIITWHHTHRRDELQSAGWKSSSFSSDDTPERGADLKVWQAIADAVFKAGSEPSADPDL